MNTFCQRLLDPLIANWPLVVIGVPGIWIGLRTLKIIQSQTEAAITAANAARTSTDTLIASERAWVMVDLEKVPGVGAVLEGTSTDGSHDLAARVRCICSNHGRTPARVSEKRVRVLVITPSEPLPIEPNLNIEIFDPTPHYLQSGQRSTKDWTTYCKGERSDGNMIVIYGIVKYRNIFSDDEVQTTFGYRVTDDGQFERITGYTRYNENS